MSEQQIYLALYRGRRDGSGWRVWAARFTDGLTRVLTRGRYSHCEIAVRLPETAGGQKSSAIPPAARWWGAPQSDAAAIGQVGSDCTTG
ncbi:hypothetical protein [Neisseria subflava]|uniref:hypothetical protein n=1 Tax=Neisseria subflava TaxID=28449 RepID=UPI00202AA88E|nr:hypothetical protein [Neisseria subflava]